MGVFGCIPFSNRKERRTIFHQLKEEFGDRVKIDYNENMVTYKVSVPRDFF
jgi:hypothetical protein